MRIVLDTNVLISGLFFGGVPGRILEAWREGRVQIVLSDEILDEYLRVGEVLAARHPTVDPQPFLHLLTVHAEWVEAHPLTEPVSSDPDDDKFVACALAAGAESIVSGDKDLLEVSGWRGVRALTPRRFIDEMLPPRPTSD